MISLILLGSVGAVCSYLALRYEFPMRSRLFRWGTVALYVALVVLMRSQVSIQCRADAFVTVFGIVVASIFWAPCLAACVVQIIAGLTRAALSLDDIIVPPAYSKAEGAAVHGKLEEAIRLYRQAAEENPEEPEPFRRMAELHLKLQRADEAIQAFREAERREQDIGNKLLLVFAISEALADLKADIPAAIETIEQFVTQYPNLAGRSYTEQRIEALRERLGAGDEREPLR